tara:strand:- start:321 stop:896 length:576 start_codon:yes stop_codon:yes gene_type:complete
MREERSGMLVWDDQHKRGDDHWWKGNDIARSRIRQLLEVENVGHDLGDYNLGTVRSLHDYEKYTGINFKLKAFQQYTIDNEIAPNPIQNDYGLTKWKDTFIKSHYQVISITRDMLPENDYESILVSFDDIDGNGIHQVYIDDQRLHDFISSDTTIRYEEIFHSNIIPYRVVFWGVSKERGWAERVETLINI